MYCSNGNDSNFTSDKRPSCSSLSSANQKYLLCLSPNESCEYTTLSSEYVLSGSGLSAITFSPAISILTVLTVFPINFIFEILCIILARIKGDVVKSLRDSTFIMAYQILMTAVFLICAISSVHFFIMVYSYSNPALLWITLIFAYILYEIIHALFLVMVWFILVKRCGYLLLNENEYKIALGPHDEKEEFFLVHMKSYCLKILETGYFENSSLGLIYLYTIFVIYWLTLSDTLDLISTEALAMIDIVFSSLFLAEICMKIFATTFRYLLDKFNLFDTMIVLSAFTLNLMGIVAKGLGVLRLIRVGVITVRKITGKKNKLRYQSKSIDPVNSVIKIFHSITELNEVNQSVKDECKWAIDIIESNKLYDLNFDFNSADKNMEIEAKTWVNFSSDVCNDATLWFELDLDDFLKEIHREEEDPNKQDEDDEKTKSILNVPHRKWTKLIKMLDAFDDWDFDIFKYYEILGEQTLPHFGFRVFHKYSLLDKFSIPETNFFELMNKIHRSFYDKSVFHCPMYTAQVSHNFYYFIKKGEITKYISDLIIMAGFIASLIHDVGHPGVTNFFLISSKHSKAIRYNDKSVLENHHLAMGFKLLLDPQNDIFESLSEAQSWSVRQIIIKMVLSTDIANHFEIVSSLNANKDFPEDTKEDKQIIMNYLLYAADHSIPCLPTMFYIKWMAEQMEEFYQQGDVERKLGYQITPFFDRTTCNPFVFQRGYIEVIVRPVYQELSNFLPFIKEEIIQNFLEKNEEIINQKI